MIYLLVFCAFYIWKETHAGSTLCFYYDFIDKFWENSHECIADVFDAHSYSSVMVLLHAYVPLNLVLKLYDGGVGVNLTGTDLTFKGTDGHRVQRYMPTKPIIWYQYHQDTLFDHV